MANHPSAEKRNRQRTKRNARNLGIRRRMRTAIKKARDAVEEKRDDKDALVQAAIQEVYRAASKKVIKANKASRTVSRLMRA